MTEYEDNTVFEKIVDEQCPDCGANQLRHYTVLDYGSSQGDHYKECINSECDFDEWECPSSYDCSVCGFKGIKPIKSELNVILRNNGEMDITIGEFGSSGSDKQGDKSSTFSLSEAEMGFLRFFHGSEIFFKLLKRIAESAREI